jgi:hypothetical protein
MDQANMRGKGGERSWDHIPPGFARMPAEEAVEKGGLA